MLSILWHQIQKTHFLLCKRFIVWGVRCKGIKITRQNKHDDAKWKLSSPNGKFSPLSQPVSPIPKQVRPRTINYCFTIRFQRWKSFKILIEIRTYKMENLHHSRNQLSENKFVQNCKFVSNLLLLLPKSISDKKKKSSKSLCNSH